MAPLNPVTHRSIDQVEHSLMQRYRDIATNENRALVDLREYDLRQGWKAWHLNNCAESLNLKCGMSKGAAWERVRVAYALMDLPHCARAMEEGRLTFCHIRALTRIATPRNEKDLVMKAIELATQTDPSEGNLDEDDSYFAKQADALVDLARSYLDGGTGKAGSTADRYQVMVHVDEAVLHDGLGTTDLGNMLLLFKASPSAARRRLRHPGRL